MAPEHLPHNFLAAPAPNDAERSGWLVGQQHVLRNRERTDERDFLKRGLNAQIVGIPGSANIGQLVEDANLTTVGPIQAAQNLDEC